MKEYGFYLLAWKNGGKYGKKLIRTAKKTGIDTRKTISKKIGTKTAEATSDLIRNKIADKITSVNKGKTKYETPSQEIYMPPEKRQLIIGRFKINVT